MIAPKAPHLKAQIAKEIYIALERLGAAPNLLSIIGSYSDTLSDEQRCRTGLTSATVQTTPKKPIAVQRRSCGNRSLSSLRALMAA
jgi:hypothetical protein